MTVSALIVFLRGRRTLLNCISLRLLHEDNFFLDGTLSGRRLGIFALKNCGAEHLVSDQEMIDKTTDTMPPVSGRPVEVSDKTDGVSESSRSSRRSPRSGGASQKSPVKGFELIKDQLVSIDNNNFSVVALPFYSPAPACHWSISTEYRH